MPEHGAPERTLRLFVAIELPGDVRRALGDAIDALKRAGMDQGLRWVRPEGIHLTLKFLGATPPAQVHVISAALQSAAAATAAFDVRPSGFGAFHGGKKAATFRTWRESYPHNVRVILVALEGATEQLGALASAIDDVLAPLGIAKEGRPFFGHLTLARVREDSDRATREEIARVLARFQPTLTREGTWNPPEIEVPFPPLTAREFQLMQSTLQRGGAVYRSLAAFTLGKKP